MIVVSSSWLARELARIYTQDVYIGRVGQVPDLKSRPLLGM